MKLSKDKEDLFMQSTFLPFEGKQGVQISHERATS